MHRGARESWDVSADLAALTRTPVAVVCSGVKSILDVPATLEYLETLGVPVVGFRTPRFPGFYLADSGSPLGWSVENEGEAARLVRAVTDLGLGDSGLVIANPLAEEDQLDPGLHDRALRAGLEEMGRLGVRGGEVTPFLLDRFAAETKGESLRVNKKIILGNARLAARIAVALAGKP
nr:pseudouridine-5'-phosphate glycosidase [Rubrobacter tropicus]